METAVGNKVLYISMSAVDGKAVVHGVATDRETLNGGGHIFVLDPARTDGKAATAEMIDWLSDHDVMGADLATARLTLADALRDYLKGSGTASGRAGLYEPAITVACPCCGETADLGLKDCMKPGGDGCCPWVICGVCRYSGPEAGSAREAIDLWNAGEVDPLILLAAKVARRHKEIDIDQIRINFMVALLDNSRGRSDWIADFCDRYPDMRADVAKFLADVRSQASGLIVRIGG